MPCGDITERIRLTINNDNRIESYSLSKKTCGGDIGSESMIIDSVGGLPIENILNNQVTPTMVLVDGEDAIESYLRQKHLSAIRTVLDVYLGNFSGGVGDSCVIAGIEYDKNSTIIEADIKLTLSAKKVAPCSHCGPG